MSDARAETTVDAAAPLAAATTGGAGRPERSPAIVRELQERFADVPFTVQETADGIPTVWAPASSVVDVLTYLKTEAAEPFAMLYDLGGVDERERVHREGLPAARTLSLSREGSRAARIHASASLTSLRS